MQHVVLTKGLQASGKSTWAKQQVRTQDNWKRINKDDLRAMLDDNLWSSTKEKFILKARDSLLTTALLQGFNVVIDDTNLDNKHWKDILFLLTKMDIDVTLREQPFPIDLEEAIKRDAARPKPIGEEAITNTWKRYLKGKAGVLEPRMEVLYEKKHLTYENDPSLPKAIICDLDGTLALMGDRSPFDASRCDLVDLPNPPVVEAVKLFFNAGYKIIFLSGRDEKDRGPTERFIIRHLPQLSGTFIHNEVARLKAQYQETPTPDLDAEAMLFLEELVKIPVDVPQAMLLMRGRKDMRKDTIIKREIWDAHIAGKWNVLCAIDDRPSVVRMWRYDVGLPVFQVSDKEF
jgi:predicted kinase